MIFNMIYAGGGSEISHFAEGTIAGSGSATLTVSGLDFKPDGYSLWVQALQYGYVYNNEVICASCTSEGFSAFGYLEKSGGGTASNKIIDNIRNTMNADGWTIQGYSSGGVTPIWNRGTYHWIAWAK